MKTTTPQTHAATGHANNLYKTLTQIQQHLDDLHGRVQTASTRPRCTATSASGTHAIHPTGQNCPHPHHHQTNMPDGHRIRAYIRKGDEQAITDAMGNEKYYQTLNRALDYYQKQLNLITRQLHTAQANAKSLAERIKKMA